MRSSPSPYIPRIVLIGAAIFTLASCSDRESTPTISPPAYRPIASNSSDDGGIDVVIAPRYDLDLHVEGSLRPGEPFHVTVSGRALYATQETEIRLILPEVAAAEETSWSHVQMATGRSSRAHLRTRRALERGAPFRERTSITIPRAGYYLVIASAHQLSDDHNTDPIGLISTWASRMAWLWIDEHGGRLTETFDTSLFPDGTYVQHGPLGHWSGHGGDEGGVYPQCSIYPTTDPSVLNTCTGDVPGPTPPPPAGSTPVKVEYDDMSNGGHLPRPLPGAAIQWTVLALPTNTVVTSGTATTDANGFTPTIDCLGPATERAIRVTVLTQSQRVRVKSVAGSFEAAREVVPCSGAPSVRANAYMSQVFINLGKTYEGHQRAFGTTPTAISAAMDVASTGYHPEVPGGELRFRESLIEVFGFHGAFVAAHEHGHLWQDRTLYSGSANNGLMRYYTSACPAQHPPESATTLSCAFGEAFADWYAVIVRDDDTGRWKTDLESNFYYTHCLPGHFADRGDVVCSNDGSIVQGAVHAFLYDLTDGSNEGFDLVQFTPTQVANAVRTCSVTLSNGSTIPYTGIDHLVFCMEQRSPYQVTVNGSLQTFFNTRAAWPTQATFVSIGQPNEVRKIWVNDLYSLRPSVGTTPHLDGSSSEPSGDPPAGPSTGCGIGIENCLQPERYTSLARVP